MKRVITFLNFFARQKDILLIVVFLTILLMLILPLPAHLLDVFITMNISISIMIMLLTLQLHNPVEFSTFPSLLLVTTLFRLAISVSTTRLILIDGDAGKIVETFGNVVVGGNLGVGLVIFLIITVVNFLVITKGADRVAEVGARFTLDGMPGKQMSVDADVRAGSLDHYGAKKARELLEREAKLFGSMDGAMKFVKGDAIAGLIIIAVNLIGGLTIGMTQFGYSFRDALSLYAILTIGDGLIAQIPALMISVAAGTMVTRVTNPEGIDLGSEIADQITANHRMLSIAGFAIAGFGFVPGFPTSIFLIIGLGMSGGIHFYQRHAKMKAEESIGSWEALLAQTHARIRETTMRTGIAPTITLSLPNEVLNSDSTMFLQEFESVKYSLQSTFEVPMGTWNFEVNGPSDNRYKISFQGELLTESEARIDCVFVRANYAYLAAVDIPCEQHFGGRDGVLVSTAYIERLQQQNIHYWTYLDLILMDVKRQVALNLELFLGIKSTASLLDDLARAEPELIADLKDTLSVQQISATLKLLVQERVPIKSRIKVFEALLEWAPKKPNPLMLLQHVRNAIGDHITRRFATDGFLSAIVVAPSLESIIREGFRTAGEESYLVMDSNISQVIIEQVKRLAPDEFKRGTDPVLITQQDIRRPLHNLLYEHAIYIPVLSYQEITPTTVVYPVDFITMENRMSAAA